MHHRVQHGDRDAQAQTQTSSPAASLSASGLILGAFVRNSSEVTARSSPGISVRGPPQCRLVSVSFRQLVTGLLLRLSSQVFQVFQVFLGDEELSFPPNLRHHWREHREIDQVFQVFRRRPGASKNTRNTVQWPTCSGESGSFRAIHTENTGNTKKLMVFSGGDREVPLPDRPSRPLRNVSGNPLFA